MAAEHVVPTGGMEKEPFIPYVEEKDYPASLQPILDPYARRMGFVPNALKLYMHRPEIAGTLWTLNSNIMRDPSSTLDQNLKRRLAAVASKINGCTYCTAHHCSMLRRAGVAGAEGWAMAMKTWWGCCAAKTSRATRWSAPASISCVRLPAMPQRCPTTCTSG